jgi:hypothetical protein
MVILRKQKKEKDWYSLRENGQLENVTGPV